MKPYFIPVGCQRAAHRFMALAGRPGTTLSDEDLALIIAQETGVAELVAALAWLESTAVNLHCALQSTAHMDPNDSRIPEITGQVIRDLLVMRNRASNAQALARHDQP